MRVVQSDSPHRSGVLFPLHSVVQGSQGQEMLM